METFSRKAFGRRRFSEINLLTTGIWLPQLDGTEICFCRLLYKRWSSCSTVRYLIPQKGFAGLADLL